MITATLILAFCLMFLLAAGGLATAIFGIRELRRTSISAFQHLKAKDLPEQVKAQTELERAQLDVAQLKDAWEKEMQDEDKKIPKVKPKIVTDINGKKFDMSELEAL